MSKERDIHKTVIGLIQSYEFLIGFVRLLIIPFGIWSIYFIATSEEVLILKIAFCALLGFGVFGCIASGVPHIRKAYQAWIRYRNGDE